MGTPSMSCASVRASRGFPKINRRFLFPPTRLWKADCSGSKERERRERDVLEEEREERVEDDIPLVYPFEIKRGRREEEKEGGVNGEGRRKEEEGGRRRRRCRIPM